MASFSDLIICFMTICSIMVSANPIASSTNAFSQLTISSPTSFAPIPVFNTGPVSSMVPQTTPTLGPVGPVIPLSSLPGIQTISSTGFPGQTNNGSGPRNDSHPCFCSMDAIEIVPYCCIQSYAINLFGISKNICTRFDSNSTITDQACPIRKCCNQQGPDIIEMCFDSQADPKLHQEAVDRQDIPDKGTESKGCVIVYPLGTPLFCRDFPTHPDMHASAE